MKKITLLAALLGSVYFSNAQVGIGTPAPSTSAMLEIAATNKGVLIPRVSLVDSETILVANVVQENGLLVYNLGSRGAVGKEVKEGFYYWNNTGAIASDAGQWIRIVNQADLDAAVENIDVTKIKELLNSVYGTNNIGGASGGSFGGMVFTPAVDTTPAKIEYVQWNGTAYVKVDITSDISDLINANETKTKIVNIDGNTYYISESFVGTEPATAAEFETAANNATSGIYRIDFVNGVTKNFQQISTTLTNILKPDSTTDYFTVQEYIQYLSQNSQLNGDTKIVIDGTTQKAKLQQWNGNDWVDVDNSAFSTIVQANETSTTLKRSENNSAYTELTVSPAGVDKIAYEYSPESGNASFIDVTADMIYSITNNSDVRSAISNILNAGGSVYYTETEIAAANNNGTLVPANTLYIIKEVNGNDVKTPIDISGTVITAITNNSETVKNILGDIYSDTTVVNTGNTWVDGGKIYKGIYTTQILAGTANITGATATTVGAFSITAPTGTALGDVISIKILDATSNTLITDSVTDVSLTTTTLGFRIGTGNMYNVLSAEDLDVKVLVEFSATVTNP